MHRFVSIFLLGLPVFLAGQAVEADRWEEYISLEGRFELRTPGPLREQIDTIETDVGKLAFHRLFYQSLDEQNSDNLVYQVSWVQYPENLFPADSTRLIEDFFQETIDESTRAVRGELAYASSITLQDHPGYLWRINYLEEKAVIKTKAFLKEGLYVAVSTVTFRQRSLNSSTDRFLDSFRFLE